MKKTTKNIARDSVRPTMALLVKGHGRVEASLRDGRQGSFVLPRQGGQGPQGVANVLGKKSSQRWLWLMAILNGFIWFYIIYIYIYMSWKKRYVNPDPKSKSCDFQAAVFIFMSRRLILNCTVETRAGCIYIRAAFSYIISVEKVSFSSFFFREQHLFHNPMAGPFWSMAEKFDSVTGKWTHLWNRLLSGQWLGAHMGWMVCRLRVFVGNWSFWLKSWGRSEVVLRSFGSWEKWLNNDPWIHSNYTIWKSDPCLNSPERVGSSVFLVDMHFLGAPTINSL